MPGLAVLTEQARLSGRAADRTEIIGGHVGEDRGQVALAFLENRVEHRTQLTCTGSRGISLDTRVTSLGSGSCRCLEALPVAGLLAVRLQDHQGVQDSTLLARYK